MKKMEIFEPAMCCESGLCGVSIDPELLRIAAAINTLKQKGIEIIRYNLNSKPEEFVTNPVINGIINEKGAEALPVILINDEIVMQGKYPSNKEITEWLEIDATILQGKECCCDKKADCC